MVYEMGRNNEHLLFSSCREFKRILKLFIHKRFTAATIKIMISHVAHSFYVKLQAGSCFNFVINVNLKSRKDS